MLKKANLKSAYGKIDLVLILLFCCLLSMRFGSTGLTWNEFFSGLLLKNGFETEGIILYTLRLPRILGAVLAGAGLSVSGVLLQSVTANELASPNIIGVNAGAGFCMVLMLFLFPEAVFLRSVGAFAGAIITTLLILTVASKGHFSKTRVILSGVAITALLNAGISFITYIDTDVLTDYNYFSVGGVSGNEAAELTIPFVVISLSFVTALILSGRIDTLCLGDSIANSLGVNVKVIRTVSLLLAGLSAAAVVSFAGLLGFVGLVVPHIARRLSDGRVGEMLLVSVPLGGSLLVLADLLGRVVLAPSEIPVGAVMSFVGAPFLLYIVLRRNKDA